MLKSEVSTAADLMFSSIFSLFLIAFLSFFWAILSDIFCGIVSFLPVSSLYFLGVKAMKSLTSILDNTLAGAFSDLGTGSVEGETRLIAGRERITNASDNTDAFLK
jgi:hypothetical protein